MSERRWRRHSLIPRATAAAAVPFPHRERRRRFPLGGSDGVGGCKWRRRCPPPPRVTASASPGWIRRRWWLPTDGFSGVGGFPRGWDKICALFIIFHVPFLFLWIVQLDFNRIYGWKKFTDNGSKLNRTFFCPIFFTLFFTYGIGFDLFFLLCRIFFYRITYNLIRFRFALFSRTDNGNTSNFLSSRDRDTYRKLWYHIHIHIWEKNICICIRI